MSIEIHCHFGIGLFVLLLLSYLCIICTSPLTGISFVNILLHSVACLTTFLMVFFEMEVFLFDEVKCFYFSFVACVLVSYLRRLSQTKGYKYLLLCFPFRLFVTSPLTFLVNLYVCSVRRV